MRLCSAVICLVLLTAGSRCDDGSDESESEEFHLARGCSQAECGATENDRGDKTSDITVLNSPRGYNITYKGSHIAVSYSHDTVSENVTYSDSDVVISDRRRLHLCIGCRKHDWGGSSSNRPTNEVTGNESPHNEKKKTATSAQGVESNFWRPVSYPGSRRPTRTTTMAPDASIGSNLNVVPFEVPSVDKDAQKGSQNEGQAADPEASSFLPSPPNCGISLNDRIMGGMPTLKGKWPWLVAYGFKDRRTSGEDLVWMCGGSLVTEKHTITVAHCTIITTHYIQVARIGDIYLNSTLDGTSFAEERPVNKKIILHPEYNKLYKRHDIAIVTLKTPFSQRYKPICLPFRRDLRNEKFVSKRAYVAGWGATDYAGSESQSLMDVKLPIVENSFCRSYYASKNVSIDDHHICAGGEAGRDACRGDSGGPLMVKNDGDGSYYLVGVVAFGSACGAEGVPGVYTRITSYLPWLEAILKG